MTDLDLVERAKVGDAAAFDELVARHHRAALRAAVAALGTLDEADDAVQDGWMAARARLGGFRGEACFRTWLLAIVWNKARDRRRRAVRWMRRLVSVDESPPAERWLEGETSAAIATATIDRRTISPEQAAMATERHARVARLVRALPRRLRDPLLLIGSGEYTYDEVAAILGQPVGTVKWRVSEARRQLRDRLDRLGF